jgi:putative phosphoesterase
MADSLRVGLISDTHGLLRPEALSSLRGSDILIHAGDIGNPKIIQELQHLAPSFAVRGNIDKGDWAADLPVTEVVEVGEVFLYVLHELSLLDLDPKAAGFSAVVSGHSHQPSIEYRSGVLFINPGSAGPRRFTLPVAVARIAVTGSELKPEIVELEL